LYRLGIGVLGQTGPIREKPLEALKLAEPSISHRIDIGTHVVGDLSGIDSQLLMDESLLMGMLKEALEAQSFTILGEQSYKFPGEASGVTGFYILSESHAAFHSYPEYGYIVAIRGRTMSRPMWRAPSGRTMSQRRRSIGARRSDGTTHSAICAPGKWAIALA
jgi:hypothetical protein